MDREKLDQAFFITIWVMAVIGIVLQIPQILIILVLIFLVIVTYFYIKYTVVK